MTLLLLIQYLAYHCLIEWHHAILELGTCKSVASGLEKKYGRTTRKLQFLTCTSLKKVLIYVALKLALDLD